MCFILSNFEYVLNRNLGIEVKNHGFGWKLMMVGKKKPLCIPLHFAREGRSHLRNLILTLKMVRFNLVTYAYKIESRALYHYYI